MSCTELVRRFVLKHIPHFIDIDDCKNNSCKNDATCIDGVNDYTCECATGYSGDNCEIGRSECKINHSAINNIFETIQASVI